MPYGMVSGMSAGIDVLDGGPRALREVGGFEGFFVPVDPLVSIAYF